MPGVCNRYNIPGAEQSWVVFHQELLGREVQRSPGEGRKRGVVPSDKVNLK